MSAQAFTDALPPATDYITYLTIIEYNLTKETLPALLQVLQDEELTRNIGWDLVNLLLPLLPESKKVLDVIVKLGNPREVVLKVTEALRMIDFDDEDADSGEEDESQNTNATEHSSNLMPVLQTQILLQILPQLHARLKTKTPSRFLSTTLQAVLATFSGAGHQSEVIYAEILDFIRAMTPVLALDAVAIEEAQMQKRLLQSFLTHAFELFAVSARGIDDDTCLAWSGRLFERLMPRRVVPGRPTITGTLSQKHHTRKQAEDNTLAAARRIDLDFNTLLDTIAKPPIAVQADSAENEEDPPDSPHDIPLSRLGSFYMLTSLCVDMLDTGNEVNMTGMNIFPVQANFTIDHIGTPLNGGLNSIGSEPMSTIDAILALCLLASSRNTVGTPSSDDEFTSFLQLTSLLSANTPQPSLRYLAHFVTSKVLHSHQSEGTRLTFIHDTMEHCPYENLKASAVEWFKNEVITACQAEHNADRTSSIFASPDALTSIATFLFPAQHALGDDADVMEKWMEFVANLSFYLAALNFYYFLLTSADISERLQVAAFHKDYRMQTVFLEPLAKTTKRFKESLASGVMARSMEDGDIADARLDLSLVDDALNRIDDKLVSFEST